MSSSDRLQPLQLQMFIPAGELQKHAPGDAVDMSGVHRDVDKVWTDKLETSKAKNYNLESERSLYDRIASEGVNTAVLIDVAGGTILDGHHRIAAAADIDPTMEVPVTHEHPWPGDIE